jgi:hypothetical protein
MLGMMGENTGNFNTAIGASTLANNTTGGSNAALGGLALYSNTEGNNNTATGSQALFSNTTGGTNTANGNSALYSNTAGNDNTATGNSALSSNTTGNGNVATGAYALLNNNADNNTAVGTGALSNNQTGSENTAVGTSALATNTGDFNTVIGSAALVFNSDGSFNTAIGRNALYSHTTGSGNIAVGETAGRIHETGDQNIYIGNLGVATESNTIRIGNSCVDCGPGGSTGPHTATFIAGIRDTATANADGVAVVIDSAGQLGTVSSSERFKKEIKPMDKTSEAVLSLRPVTFHYKTDSKGTAQFGLIAEEVAKVNPNLVVRDRKGEIYSVRYDAVNAMLLNEFLKEHGKVQELESARIAEQKEIAELKQQLKTQAAAIQKVSERVELSRSAPQVVENR